MMMNGIMWWYAASSEHGIQWSAVQHGIIKSDAGQSQTHVSPGGEMRPEHDHMTVDTDTVSEGRGIGLASEEDVS